MKFEPTYLNAVLLSDDGESVVFLKKLSGPEFLIGKYNFVGGKQEPGETHLDGIIREVKEESGIDVPPERFYSIDYREFEKDGKFYKLENFAAVVPPEILNNARTVEKEPIFNMPLKDLIRELQVNEKAFNYDFKYLLTMALESVPEEFNIPEFKSLSGVLNSDTAIEVEKKGFKI